MKKTVLFGAGQVGAMVSRLLGSGYKAVCFADNSESKWGGTYLGLPVVSPRESLICDPDCVCLCVLDDGRASEMEAQLSQLGYDGELLRPDALGVFDARAATMRLLAEQIHGLQVPGDVAELGVYRGDFAVLINAAFPDRMFHLFDTFEGFSEKDVALERSEGLSRAQAGDFSETNVNTVWKLLPYPEQTEFHKGWFPDTFKGCEGRQFAFISVDADLYAPTIAALELFWPRLSPGGAVIVHDVNGTQYKGAGKAVNEFCHRYSLLPTPICDLHGSVVLRKPL